MHHRIGQECGTYRLTSLLMRGPYVDSYLGDHLRVGTVALIKLFHGRVTTEAAFLNEAQQLARLAHPQITRMLDFGFQEGSVAKNGGRISGG